MFYAAQTSERGAELIVNESVKLGRQPLLGDRLYFAVAVVCLVKFVYRFSISEAFVV